MAPQRIHGIKCKSGDCACSYCHPSLAGGIQLRCHNNDWALGNPVDIIPVNVIDYNYHITYVHVEGISELDKCYEIQFFKKSDNSYLTAFRTKVTDKKSTADSGNLTCGMIPANDGVYAKAAIEGGDASATITISVRIAKF